MTHEDIVQESKKYWQQMEAHASKPTNSMVRCISGLQPGFAPNCSSTFSLFSSHYYAFVPSRSQQTRLATEEEDSCELSVLQCL